MFITCPNCPDPYTCSDRAECKQERQEFDKVNNLEEAAKEIWELLYPERSKWNNLTEDTKSEWIRFTKTSEQVLKRMSLL